MNSDTAGMTREQWIQFAHDPDPPKIEDDVRDVFERYSKVPADEVVKHVTAIREKAFSIFPYPCIGRWRFLNLALGRHPRYQDVKNRMLTGKEIFLDLGCAFAQDLRRLVADGVDSSKCYGSDLRLEFIDIGYELFRDGETLKSKFIEADIFQDKTDLSELYGKVNIINASSFFHLFSYDQQKHIARQCLKLFTGKKGDLLIGRQVGNVHANEFMARDNQQRFVHDLESWTKMWKEIGDEAGVEFDVQVKFLDGADLLPKEHHATLLGRADGTKMLLFSVERV